MGHLNLDDVLPLCWNWLLLVSHVGFGGFGDVLVQVCGLSALGRLCNALSLLAGLVAVNECCLDTVKRKSSR